MSESTSDSTDSDNNNVSPFYNQYLRLPQERYPVNREMQIMSSSDSELSLVSEGSPLSSQYQSIPPRADSIPDVELCNASEDLDYMSDPPTLSPSDSLFQSINKQNNEINRRALKTSSGNILNRLYKREIGGFNNCAAWRNKFYQSIVTLQKLKLSKQLKAHRGCVNSLGFNHSGTMIASGSDDCKICLWNWSEGKCILNYGSEHSGNIFQTKFITTQGNHIVSSGRDGRVALYTLSNSEVVNHNVLTRHDGSCNKLAVHIELPYVVLSSGEDGVVKSIDIRESDSQSVNVTKILHQRNDREITMDIYGIDINPMKPWEFLINGDDEYVRVYDRRDISSGPTRKLERPYLSGVSPSAYETHITSAVYSYCGTEILASYSSDDMYLFGPDDSPELHHYSGHTNRMTIKSVNFYGPRSEYVMSGSDCGNIFIWDKKTEEIVQKKHADRKGVVNVLEPHPHLPVLATSGLDHTIKIWEPLNRWHQPNRQELRMLVVESFQKKRRRYRQEGYLMEFRQLMDHML